MSKAPARGGRAKKRGRNDGARGRARSPSPVAGPADPAARAAARHGNNRYHRRHRGGRRNDAVAELTDQVQRLLAENDALRARDADSGGEEDEDPSEEDPVDQPIPDHYRTVADSHKETTVILTTAEPLLWALGGAALFGGAVLWAGTVYARKKKAKQQAAKAAGAAAVAGATVGYIAASLGIFHTRQVWEQIDLKEVEVQTPQNRQLTPQKYATTLVGEYRTTTWYYGMIPVPAPQVSFVDEIVAFEALHTAQHPGSTNTSEQALLRITQSAYRTFSLGLPVAYPTMSTEAFVTVLYHASRQVSFAPLEEAPRLNSHGRLDF